MTYEHVNSFIKKKKPSSLFLFHSCICFVSDAATNSPLNVLLKKNNCCTRFMYLFYIDIFMYLFTVFSYEAELLKFRSNIKRLHLFLSYSMKHNQHRSTCFLILLLNWDLIDGLTKHAAH